MAPPVVAWAEKALAPLSPPEGPRRRGVKMGKAGAALERPVGEAHPAGPPMEKMLKTKKNSGAKGLPFGPKARILRLETPRSYVLPSLGGAGSSSTTAAEGNEWRRSEGASIVRAVDQRLRLIAAGSVIGPVGVPWWCAATVVIV